VKKISSDNGSDFKNLQVEEYLEEEGIKHEFSAPYTPQQNGVVERKNAYRHGEDDAWRV
jgi:transposase InsO family protein